MARRNENQEHQERLLAELGYDSTIGNPVDLMIEAQGTADLAPDEREERMFDLMRSAEQAVSSRYARRDACIARAADEHRRLMTLRDLLDRKVEAVESAPGLVIVQTTQVDPRIDRVLDLLENLVKSSAAPFDIEGLDAVTGPRDFAVTASEALEQKSADAISNTQPADKDAYVTPVTAPDSGGRAKNRGQKKKSVAPRATKGKKTGLPAASDGEYILGVKPTRSGWKQVPTIIADAREAVAAGTHGEGVPDTRFYRSTWRRRLYEAAIANALADTGEHAEEVSPVEEGIAEQPVSEVDKTPNSVAVPSADVVVADSESGDNAVLPPLADLDTMRRVAADILKAQGNSGMNLATLHDRLRKRYDFKGRGVGYVLMLLKTDKFPFVEKNLNWYYTGA